MCIWLQTRHARICVRVGAPSTEPCVDAAPCCNKPAVHLMGSQKRCHTTPHDRALPHCLQHRCAGTHSHTIQATKEQLLHCNTRHIHPGQRCVIHAASSEPHLCWQMQQTTPRQCTQQHGHMHRAWQRCTTQHNSAQDNTGALQILKTITCPLLCTVPCLPPVRWMSSRLHKLQTQLHKLQAYTY